AISNDPNTDVDLSGYLDNTDTQLTEAQVDAYADNNGYLEVEVDGSTTNEIQDISLSGTDLSISSGSTIDLSSIDTDTNTQLTEAQVDAYANNNGYLLTEVDGSVTNELQTISKTGSTVTLSDGGGSFTDTDTNTQLTEAQVDAFADNNGYLETEVDGSVTNEIQNFDVTNLTGTTLQLSLTQDATTYTIDLSSLNNSGTDSQDLTLSGNTLAISNDPNTDVDLSGYLDDTDTQLTESQVDAYADNNGYLETEVDGSITNELQTLTDNGATFSLSNSGGTVTKTVDTNTQLTEAQVDAFADNNGYNEVIGTDSDINTSGSYVVDQVFMTDGVVTSHTTRQLFQLEAEDDRDLAPEDIAYTEDVKTYFTSKLGLDTGNSQNSDYQDAIVFNTWGDGSGGDANLLSFDKSEKKIYHYQADQAATNWGTPEVLAYVSDIPASGGKFVDGTDTDDAVYMDGKVGIGTTTPSADFDLVGDAEINGELTAENQIQVKGSNNASTKIEIGVNRTSDNYSWIDLIGDNTYTDYGLRIVRNNTGANTSSDIHHRGTGNLNIKNREAAPIVFLTTNAERMRIKPDGKVGIGTNNPQANLHLDGQQIITNSNGTDGASVFIGRSGNVSQAAEINFVENSSASYAYGFRFRLDGVGNKLYLEANNGSVGAPLPFDLMGFNRTGGVEVENSLAVNGTYSGEYPKDSGFNNVVFGGGNFSAMTIGSQNFVSGDNNGQTATSIYRSALFGLDNSQFASGINYTFSAGAYNNENNLTGCNYNFMNGYLNARAAQGMSYSFFNGRENAESASQAGYSFYSGFQNLHSSTSAGNYNFMAGRENARAAFDSDYSFIVGYRNVFAGAANLDFSFMAGLENAYNSAAAITSTTLIGSRNGYTTTGSLSHSTMIGFENGKLPTVALNNTILLGFRQGYSIGSEGAAAYRLAIGMFQDNPLIYGEFDSALVKINGSLTVTDRIGGIATKGAAFDDTGQIVETDSLSISNSNQNILDGVNRLIDVDGKLSIAAGTATNAGLIVSDDGLINGDKYVAINANVNSTTADGFYAIENEGIRIRVGDEDEGRILYSSDGNGDAVWGQADNVGRITTTLGLWSDERQVLLAGTAYGSFGAFTFPPSGWTTSQQHDGDVLTFINRSGSTRELTGDIEGTSSSTVDVLDDDTIRLVYYEGGDYWIVLSNN
ncbi:MAG TPA: hypothetical protein DCW83_06355, partial [Saprospirales bacterium]|nr:hypothetical protein [Saprospirales bacterium]